MTFWKLLGSAAFGIILGVGAASACPYHEKTFSAWDTDKDQVLSQKEFDTGVTGSANFASLDRDRSGSLSAEEFSAYVAGTGN